MTTSPIILAAFAAVPVEDWCGGNLMTTPDNKMARIWLRGTMPLAVQAPEVARRAAFHESGRIVRERNYAELCDRIVRLRKAGMSISNIGARVGRANTTVKTILRKRGMQDD